MARAELLSVPRFSMLRVNGREGDGHSGVLEGGGRALRERLVRSRHERYQETTVKSKKLLTTGSGGCILEGRGILGTEGQVK